MAMEPLAYVKLKLLAVKLLAAAVMATLPTLLVNPAVVAIVGAPLSTELVSLLTKPVTVYVSAGLALPYTRVLLSAVTTKPALPMLSPPLV